MSDIRKFENFTSKGGNEDLRIFMVYQCMILPSRDKNREMQVFLKSSAVRPLQ